MSKEKEKQEPMQFIKTPDGRHIAVDLMKRYGTDTFFPEKEAKYIYVLIAELGTGKEGEPIIALTAEAGKNLPKKYSHINLQRVELLDNQQEFIKEYGDDAVEMLEAFEAEQAENRDLIKKGEE